MLGAPVVGDVQNMKRQHPLLKSQVCQRLPPEWCPTAVCDLAGVQHVDEPIHYYTN